MPHSSDRQRFADRIAVVTGITSGIGRACGQALLAEGATVIGVGRSEGVERSLDGERYLGLRADVTDAAAMRTTAAEVQARFDRTDVLVLSAGVFPASRSIADHDPDLWRSTFAVNVDGVANTLSAFHPLLTRAAAGGRVALVGSRNVLAPGPGASTYSASKAAATQLVRVAAIEWAADDIRVNTVHPDSVFDTGIWSDELIEARAAHYGLSVEEYRRANLLGRDLVSADVASVVLDLCADGFAHVTGAQIPIDGGNLRTI